MERNKNQVANESSYTKQAELPKSNNWQLVSKRQLRDF